MYSRSGMSARYAGLLVAAVILALGVVKLANADDGACVIAANGAKLCGDDAKAFCRQFAGPVGNVKQDVQTAGACRAAGVEIQASPTAGGPTEATAATAAAYCRSVADRAKDTPSKGCARAVAYLGEQGDADFSPDQADCIRAGGEPLGCVTDEQ